ncbi:MAG: hypothetical protein ACLPYB_16300 [Desulfobaccales bacterium]
MDKIVPILSIINYLIDRLFSVGRWIQAHNALVISVATAFIAAFTVMLWFTNRKLWKVSYIAAKAAEKSAKAAEKSADALPAIERAYLYVYVSPKNVSKFVIGENLVEVTVSNCGRTPAIIKNIVAISGYFNTPPAICQGIPIPIKPHETIIAGRPHPDEEMPFVFKITIADSDQMEDVIRENSHMGIFIHGCIKYEDIFRNPQETRFYWRYIYSSHTFIRVEDKERNYQT